MDRNQSWFHGTTAEIIYHFKYSLNAKPGLFKKHVRMFVFADLQTLPKKNKTDVIKQGKGVK